MPLDQNIPASACVRYPTRIQTAPRPRAAEVPADLDIVIPLFNEEAIVAQLHQRVLDVCKQLDLTWRIVFVDDGSSDQTVALLKQLLHPNDAVEIVSLVRNFGQPAAILAGMQHTSAAAVVVMDGDLQDPPELIPELVTAWREGNPVVIAQRPERRESSWLRGLAFKSFHRLFRRLSDVPIPENCGTFCLLSRESADAIMALPEVHRFFPGLRAWVCGTPKLITYERPPRAGGEPKQTFSRLLRYAGDGILGFSRKPTALLLQLGMALFSLGSLAGLLTVATWLVGFDTHLAWLVASGFLTLLGLQLASCGFLGDLLLRVQEQVKERPPYLVAEHFVAPRPQSSKQAA